MLCSGLQSQLLTVRPNSTLLPFVYIDYYLSFIFHQDILCHKSAENKLYFKGCTVIDRYFSLHCK